MIHEQLSTGEMPPKEETQPAAAEKQVVLEWVAGAQRALEAGSTRRLNRRELGGALQDVTGVKVDFAYSVPGDGKVDGFDTGAEGLQDAADSVNQAMVVTRRAVDAIRFLEPPPGEVVRANLVNVEGDPRQPFNVLAEQNIVFEKPPTMFRPGLGLLMEPKWPRDGSNSLFKVSAPPAKAGVIRMKFSVSSYSGFPDLPNPILWVEAGGRVLDRREITGPVDLEYHVQFEDAILSSKGRLGVSLTPRVELAYRVPGFENEDRSKPGQFPGGAGLFRPVWSRGVQKEPEQQPRPFLVLKQVELEPHYVAAWPPKEWDVDLGEISDSLPSAEKLLSLWIDRAYRRPVTDAEQKPFLAFYRRLHDEGLTFDDALRSTFQAVLMSPPFRHLDSTAHENRVIADHAVASRLSFMLIGDPPDADLRALAASGALRRPAVLQAQAARLLADPQLRRVHPAVRHAVAGDGAADHVGGRPAGHGELSVSPLPAGLDARRDLRLHPPHADRRSSGTGIGFQRLDDDERHPGPALRLRRHSGGASTEGEAACRRRPRGRHHVARRHPIHALLDGRQLGDLSGRMDRPPHPQ